MSFSSYSNVPTVVLPNSFSFREGDRYEFESVLSWFNWSLKGESHVLLDMQPCVHANFQTLSLLVLYVWWLKLHNAELRIEYDGINRKSASNVWKQMGAKGWSQVLYDTRGMNFLANDYKPLFAIRDRTDFSRALSKAQQFSSGFNVEYEKTLHYILSELLYNTLEHGKAFFGSPYKQRKCPSIVQFTWYKERNELSFIVADLGIGIKQHLELAHPPFASDIEAVHKAIKPRVSGTFGASEPYSPGNNAGMGLYISTQIAQRLHGNMFIVSGSGLLHISPRDITCRTMQAAWPGTFAMVSIQLDKQNETLQLQSILSDLRESAKSQLERGDALENTNRLSVNMENHFGRYAEDKDAAITFRDDKLMPAIDADKTILLDFSRVESSPHSFLSALMARPIQRLGMASYKKIKVTNAQAAIRETIDYILDENT